MYSRWIAVSSLIAVSCAVGQGDSPDAARVCEDGDCVNESLLDAEDEFVPPSLPDAAPGVDVSTNEDAALDVAASVDAPADVAPFEAAAPDAAVPDVPAPVDVAPDRTPPPPDVAAPACPGGCSAPQACQQGPGTCAAGNVCVYARRPAGSTCRAAAGACDAVETCDGTSTGCPLDAFAPAGTQCRPAACAGDVAEACSGTASACPAACDCAGEPCCGTRCGTGLTCTAGVCSAACTATPVTASGRAQRECAGGCAPFEELRGEGGYIEVRSGDRRDRVTFSGATVSGRVRDVVVRSVRASGSQIAFGSASLTLTGATASGAVDFGASELATIEGSGSTLRVTSASGVSGVITLTSAAACP